jgi:hypothetical protein
LERVLHYELVELLDLVAGGECSESKYNLNRKTTYRQTDKMDSRRDQETDRQTGRKRRRTEGQTERQTDRKQI